LCAGVEAGRVVDGRGAARLSFVVAGAVDVHAGYGQRVGLSCSRRSRCISLRRQRPQGLRRRLLRSHCVERWHDGVPREKSTGAAGNKKSRSRLVRMPTGEIVS
jgi:hypothetical protein